jgi:hypothetical protein
MIHKKAMALGVGAVGLTASSFYFFINATVTPNPLKVRVITESPGAIKAALDTAVTYAADTARSYQLKNNVVLFRRNGLPFKTRLLIGSSYDMSLDGSDFILDTCSGKLGCNYRYRESLSAYSYADKSKAIWTNIFSKKENWFSLDKPVGIEETNSVVTNSTVYEAAYPVANGVALISGEILKGAGREFACDTENGICVMENAELTTRDVFGFWSLYNKPTYLDARFVRYNITAEEAKEIQNELSLNPKGMDLTFSMTDASEKGILKIKMLASKITGFQMANPRPNDPVGPDTKYHVYFWVRSTKIEMPCIIGSEC